MSMDIFIKDKKIYIYIYCDGVKDHTTSGDLVYPLEVITEAEGAVRLRDHDDRAGPRPVRWFNYP